MSKSHKQVSFMKRVWLQIQLVLRWGPKVVAAGLQRARSTASRELGRNCQRLLPEDD
jgi:IS30 family transposase